MHGFQYFPSQFIPERPEIYRGLIFTTALHSIHGIEQFRATSVLTRFLMIGPFFGNKSGSESVGFDNIKSMLPDAVGMIDAWSLDPPADGRLLTGHPVLPVQEQLSV